MFKKYFFLFLVLFSYGIALSQDGVEEIKKSGWSTKKKVIVGVAAVAVVTATGVIIYYGPVACIAAIKSTAVAAKLKVVTLAAKATGAGHVFTGADGAVYVLTSDGKVVLGCGGAIVTAAGKVLKDSLSNSWKNTSVGSTVRVVKALSNNQTKLVPISFLDYVVDATVVMTNSRDQITHGDIFRAFNYTKGIAEDVRDSIREGLYRKVLKEEVEEEWVPKVDTTNQVKLIRMYAKEPLQSSDLLQKFPC